MSTDKKDPHAARIAELREKHGPIAHLTLPDGRLLAFRAPRLEEHEDWLDRIHRGNQRGPIYREAANTTSITPSPEELAEVFERYPALPARISDALAELAGADLVLAIKKE